MINVSMSPDLSENFQQVVAHVTAKTTETKSHVTTRANETKSLVSAENDATQSTLSDMSTGADLNANTVNVNAHTSAKADEVKAHIDAGTKSVIKSIQRGAVTAAGDGNIMISEVNPDKTMVNLLSSGGTDNYGARVRLVNSTTLYTYARMKTTADTGYCHWEVIEFV